MASANCRPVTLEEYGEIKQNIKDGMWAYVTMGGSYPRFDPGFRLEIVRWKDMPKAPPRPLGLEIANAPDTWPGGLHTDRPSARSGFIYQDRGAYDSDKGITIIRIHKFEDIGPDDPTPYLYTQGDLAFEFRASRYRESRTGPSKDGPKLISQCMAIFVIEDSIKRSMASAKCRSLSPEEYEALKQNIKDGMWVLEAPKAPEFRIEFVDRAEQVSALTVN
jgi:hypothetical protein